MEQNTENNNKLSTPEGNDTLPKADKLQSADSEPASTPSAPLSQNYPNLPRIRTYEGDLATTVHNQGESRASIISKESAKVSKANPVQKKASITKIRRTNRRMTIIILSILILVVLVLLTIVILSEQPDRNTPVVYVPSEIIFADHVEHLDPETLAIDANATLQQAIRDSSGGSNTVVELFIGEGTTKTRSDHITTEEFFNVLGITPPGMLTRALKSDFVLGTHILTYNQPFLIFEVESYETAFAGMLEWEPTVTNDLLFITESSRLYDLRVEEDSIQDIPLDENISTTTPTTTAETESITTDMEGDDAELLIAEAPFKDQVVKNHDVRYTIWENGSTKLLYAFPNKDTLVITTRESTLIEVLNRINQARFAR